ncbi:MAG: septum formation protein Maf [Lachnospiraceae bacterium]|nr:septum formation protein Maf [Lachnospiraceae bacterium]
MMKIILASASPRRKELLEQIGIAFEIVVSNVEEMVTATVPARVVEELSSQKAMATWELLKNSQLQVATGSAINESTKESEELLVIGADTIVVCEGQILGKPKDKGAAKQMLQLLQGRSHEVFTGVTLLHYNLQKEQVDKHSFYEVTEVLFYPMSEEEIEDYVESGDPLDKAGAYGIQGFCARYISGIKGDYNNVVGLPVGRLYQEMKNLLEGREAI